MPTLATCHCAAVRLTCAPAPTEVTECTCSICRRYGVLWAYYEPSQVRIEGGATEVYEWDAIQFHRCVGCGCVTHWSAVDPGVNRMGVRADRPGGSGGGAGAASGWGGRYLD